jgi:mannose-1-phosphate guanylyltransferase
MGTAGPLKLAESILRADNKEGLFFTFNSDIICDFPLEDLLQTQRKHNQEGTMVLAKVEDPRRFGVIVVKPSGQI